jgi:uncharacterized protein
MDYQYLKDNNLIIFEAIVGSTAYGTNLPTSDQDRKYVYMLPLDAVLRDEVVEQVNDDKNDLVGYELSRFMELVATNNPNILELLAMPEDCILHTTDLWKKIEQNREKLLSKLCKNSFAQYATSQIKKARGLNKKINNPMSRERKTPLHFCYVIDHLNGSSYDLIPWLQERDIDQKFVGAVNVPNSDGVFTLFHDPLAQSLFGGLNDAEQQARKLDRKKQNLPMGLGYKGIINGEDLDSNAIRYSSVPKGEKAIATISYNRNGYTQYCRQYREYWEWVDKRNEDRFRINTEHGKDYDSKNMSHCIRLLEMSYEIATEQKIVVRRPNREELLKIRMGEMDYDDILQRAEAMVEKVEAAFEASSLPDKPDQTFIKDLLEEIRIQRYGLY